MKKSISNSYIYFFGALVLTYLFFFFFRSDLIHKYFFYILSFNFFIDLIFKFLNKGVFVGHNHSVLIVIFSTILRLSLSIIFIFLFGLFGVVDFMLFTINYLVIFLLFIIFEITILLINLQR